MDLYALNIQIYTVLCISLSDDDCLQASFDQNLLNLRYETDSDADFNAFKINRLYSNNIFVHFILPKFINSYKMVTT